MGQKGETQGAGVAPRAVSVSFTLLPDREDETASSGGSAAPVEGCGNGKFKLLQVTCR